MVTSAGAALGPLLAGVISPTGWKNVFYMLITADVLACLVRILLISDQTSLPPHELDSIKNIVFTVLDPTRLQRGPGLVWTQLQSQRVSVTMATLASRRRASFFIVYFRLHV